MPHYYGGYNMFAFVNFAGGCAEFRLSWSDCTGTGGGKVTVQEYYLDQSDPPSETCGEMVPYGPPIEYDSKRAAMAAIADLIG